MHTARAQGHAFLESTAAVEQAFAASAGGTEVIHLLGRAALCSALIAAGTTLAANSVQAQTHPAHIYRRCAQAVIGHTRECMLANYTAATRCAREIRALLRQGDAAAATELARTCAAKIEQQSAECIESIRTLCDECAAAFEEQGVERLAMLLDALCGRAVNALETSAQQAYKLLERALAAAPSRPLERRPPRG